MIYYAETDILRKNNKPIRRLAYELAARLYTLIATVL
jgi:hypothetical protein